MSGAVPITELIRQAGGGDERAFRAVFDATYDDLRRIARARLTHGARGTLLDTTVLVHESFLRLIKTRDLSIDDRSHFLRYAGHVMRSIIVDFARERVSQRRGGGHAKKVTLDTSSGGSTDAGEDEVMRIHEALADLAVFDQHLVEVVEMRYFAGMTEKEIADAFGVTERTVRRHWEKARLLLAATLAPDAVKEI